MSSYGVCPICGEEHRKTSKTTDYCPTCFSYMYGYSREYLVFLISKLQKQLLELQPIDNVPGKNDYKRNHANDDFFCTYCQWTGKGSEAEVDEVFDITSSEENNLLCPVCEDIIEPIK
jgi:hypothetical protein